MLGVSHFEKWKFFNSTISIRMFIVGIANLFKVCECKKIDDLYIENRIEIDRSEAEKYKFIRESCVFSILFFQPNNTVRVRTLFRCCNRLCLLTNIRLEKKF